MCGSLRGHTPQPQRENEDSVTIRSSLLLPFCAERTREHGCRMLSLVDKNKEGNENTHAFAGVQLGYGWRGDSTVPHRQTRGWPGARAAVGRTGTEVLGWSMPTLPKTLDSSSCKNPEIEKQTLSDPHLPQQQTSLQSCLILISLENFSIPLHIGLCSSSKIIF